MIASSRAMAGAIERRNVAASTTERAVAIGVALTLVVAAVLAFPARQGVFGLVPGFLAAYGALLAHGADPARPGPDGGSRQPCQHRPPVLSGNLFFFLHV